LESKYKLILWNLENIIFCAAPELPHEFTYIQSPYAYLGDVGFVKFIIAGVFVKSEELFVKEEDVGDKYVYKMYIRTTNNIPKMITVTLIFL
jgi:hypothetical protein